MNEIKAPCRYSKFDIPGLQIRGLCFFAYWVIFYASLLSTVVFFSKSSFLKNSFRNIIRVSNSLDPDQARHSVAPDLGPNCLQSMLVNKELSILKNIFPYLIISISTKP